MSHFLDNIHLKEQEGVMGNDEVSDHPTVLRLPLVYDIPYESPDQENIFIFVLYPYKSI